MRGEGGDGGWGVRGYVILSRKTFPSLKSDERKEDSMTPSYCNKFGCGRDETQDLQSP